MQSKLVPPHFHNPEKEFETFGQWYRDDFLNLINLKTSFNINRILQSMANYSKNMCKS